MICETNVTSTSMFFGFDNTYEEYLGTERLDCVSKKNLIV